MKYARAIATPVLPLVGGRFSPASLFALNEVGGWYDPSDLTTMFQDAAGTTAAALESPVGLVLDKSKGLVLGSELVTNGDFSNSTTGWESGSGNTTLTVVNGEAKSEITTATSPALLYRPVAFATSNVLYKVEFEIYSPNYSGSIRCSLNDSLVADAFSFTTTVSATKTKVTSYLRAGPTPKLYITSTPSALALGSIVYFDNISVKQVQGNHLSQSTSTARPVLSARVNLLTYSEQFDNAAWSKGGLVTAGMANVTTAPDGTSTADQLIETNATAAHYAEQGGGTVPASTNYIASVAVKQNGRQYVTVAFTGITGTLWAAATFDLTGTGSVSKTGNGSGSTYVSSSITSLGNGWFRCSVTGAHSSSTTGLITIQTSDSGTPTYGSYSVHSYAGNGTSGVYIWGADLRPSNAGVGLPAYQRVGAATSGTSSAAGNADYDTTGFPLYLKFDGVDDYLQATSFILPLIERMTIAGLKENAAVGDQALVSVYPSTGNDYNSTTGYVFCPGDHSTIRFNAVGSTSLSYYPQWTASPSALIPPSVITEDKTSGAGYLRVNGTQVASDTSFTEFASQSNGGLLLGARWIASAISSSFEFNGNVYGVVILGRRATASEIASVEAWMNGKTKAYA